MSSPTRSSWAGFTMDQSRHTPTASTSSSRNRVSTARTLDSSSGAWTVPSARMRSSTVKVSDRGTYGSGYGTAMFSGSALPPSRYKQDVSVPGGGDQRGAGGAPLEHGIRRGGRCVDERLGVAQELFDRQRVVGGREAQGLVHAVEHVGGSGRRLVQTQDPLGIGEHEIAERASGVDSDREPHGPPPVRPVARA